MIWIKMNTKKRHDKILTAYQLLNYVISDKSLLLYYYTALYYYYY